MTPHLSTTVSLGTSHTSEVVESCLLSEECSIMSHWMMDMMDPLRIVYMEGWGKEMLVQERTFPSARLELGWL